MRRCRQDGGRRCEGRGNAGRTLIEALEARTLLTSVPVGAVTAFNRNVISGYAFNRDDGQGALSVDITVNGVTHTVAANGYRAGLAGRFGSPYHAFTYVLPALPPGKSTIVVAAWSRTTGAKTRLRAGTLNNPAPVGTAQVLTPTRIVGWAYDPDSAGPIQVRVDVDGVAGVPFSTNVLRKDVASRRGTRDTTMGFDVSGDFAGHVVEVFALDAPSGRVVRIFSNNHLPVGHVDVNDGYSVTGWAVDPDAPEAAVNVRVTIDGVTLTTVAANLENDEVPATYNSTAHGFDVAVPGLTPGTHTINVYAVDAESVTTRSVLIGSAKVTDAAPVGHVDTIDATAVTGWALDPDLGASAATVNVYADGALIATVLADGEAEDVPVKYGSVMHGFTVDLSGLGTASHAITVTAVDNRASDENQIVIYDGFINNHPPIGSFDGVVNGMLTGWAYDPDAPDWAAAVDVYVDGDYATTINADQPRADVDAELPTPNHAFNVPMPDVGFGTHRIDLRVSESQGNVSVPLGSKMVTNVRPTGAIETANASVISGWAADPDGLGQSLLVRVFVNGVEVQGMTADIVRPDLLSRLMFATHPDFSAYGYSIALALAPGRNQVDVFAVDSNNNLMSPIGSRVINV